MAGFSGVNGASLWAADASASAVLLVEVALGRCLVCWLIGVPLMVLMLSKLLLGCPVIRMSGLMEVLFGIRSLEHLLVVLVSLPTRQRIAGVAICGVMLIVFALRVRFSLGLFSQSKGLKCGVSFWLGSQLMLCTWVDNLGVVRHVGRLLDGRSSSTLLELVTDGDQVLLIETMLHLRGLDTVRITKVKGHADEVVVHDGRVRELDSWVTTLLMRLLTLVVGVGHAVTDARRKLSGVCGRRYRVALDLHRFFIAISRAVVNHDGSDGIALDPLVWSAGALPMASASSCGSRPSRAAWTTYYLGI